MMKTFATLRCLLLVLLINSCTKQDQFLDIKSNKADLRPTTLSDFRAIMDNDVVLNTWIPSMGLLGSDQYYVSDMTWQAALNAQERNAYIWAKDIYNGEPGFNWQTPYAAVGYANIVLEGLQTIPVNNTNKTEWDAIRGTALFFRSFAFYELAQTFAPPYQASSAATDLGIPLKLTADVNVLVPRSTLEQTYQQIHQDLEEAVTLLPNTTLYSTRPSRLAAYSLQARIWLTQGNYAKAKEAADAVLSVNSQLTDYNTLNPSLTIPFPAYPNTVGEVLFYAVSGSFGLLSYNNLKVDTLLYRSYANNDLRKSLFYRDNGANGIAFRGDYTGTIIPAKFSGFATNELYLIRAEANARLGNTTAALADLNSLLAKRWKTGTYVPVTAVSADDALSKILAERRKEIPFACNLRWEDLRRLNLEPAYAKTLSRVINGQTYTLPPNDPRYVYPIPDNEIKFSNLIQNPR